MGRPRQSAQGPQPSCRSRAPSASWPRSHGTCPPRSPKKTGRSCLACSTADHIAEDPLGRQPTTGIMARTDAASSRNTPGGSARGTRRVRLFCLTAQVGPRWADRSWPPTEQARQHNIPGGAANELLPSTPNTPPASAHHDPRNLAPGLTWSRPSVQPPGQSSLRRPDIRSSRPIATASCDFHAPPISCGPLLTQTNVIDAVGGYHVFVDVVSDQLGLSAGRTASRSAQSSRSAERGTAADPALARGELPETHWQ